MRMCLGEIGISPGAFYKMDFREIQAMIGGYSNKVERDERLSWERVRWQTWWLVNLQVQKKHQFRDPKDLLLLPWEKIRQTGKIDKKKAQEILNKWDKIEPGRGRAATLGELLNLKN